MNIKTEILIIKVKSNYFANKFPKNTVKKNKKITGKVYVTMCLFHFLFFFPYVYGYFLKRFGKCISQELRNSFLQINFKKRKYMFLFCFNVE